MKIGGKIFLIIFVWMVSLSAVARSSDSNPSNPSSSSDNLYRLGVQDYLNGDNVNAIRKLKNSLSNDGTNEKARKLLLKIILKSLQDSIQEQNADKTRQLMEEGRTWFPSNANFSETKTSGVPPPPVLSPPVVPPVKKNTPLPRHAAQKVRKIVSQNIPAEKPAIPENIPKRQSEITGPVPEINRNATGSSGFSMTAFLFLFICLMFCVVIIVMIRRYQKTLSEQTKVFQDILKKEEEQKILLEKKIEAQKKTEIIPVKIPPIKNEEIKITLPQPKVQIQPPQIQPRFDPPAEKIQQSFANHQKEQILGVMSNIAAPERRVAWERIAGQMQNLYETSHEDAIQFVKELSKSDDPWKRMSIVVSLVRIGTTETMDILLNMRNDPDTDVQREVLRNMKVCWIQDGLVPDVYRRKIENLLTEEKNKGEWVL